MLLSAGLNIQGSTLTGTQNTRAPKICMYARNPKIARFLLGAHAYRLKHFESGPFLPYGTLLYFSVTSNCFQ